MRKKGIQEVLVGSVMSTRGRKNTTDYEMSEIGDTIGYTKDLQCQLSMKQCWWWWCMFLNKLKVGKLQYVNNLLLICKTIEGLVNKFRNWMEAQ